MSNWIETIREAATLIETVFPTNAWRMPVIKNLRAIADSMEKAEPVGVVNVTDRQVHPDGVSDVIELHINDYGYESLKGDEQLFTYPPDAQAKIDALMLEYCPDEMTQERKDEYAKHQKPKQGAK